LSSSTTPDVFTFSSQSQQDCCASWTILASEFSVICKLNPKFNSFAFSFPGGSNENLLHKFNNIHKENPFYEKPVRKENAFIIKHYAGKVKYQVSRCRRGGAMSMTQENFLLAGDGDA
jgi:hypothetical protein